MLRMEVQDVVAAWRLLQGWCDFRVLHRLVLLQHSIPYIIFHLDSSLL